MTTRRKEQPMNATHCTIRVLVASLNEPRFSTFTDVSSCCSVFWRTLPSTTLEKNRPSDCLTLSADYVQLKLRLILSKRATPGKWQCCLGATPPQRLVTEGVIVQELCESRGGRLGLSVLTSLLVSVDVKIYWTVLRHWSQLVPNMSTDIWGH